MFKIPVGWHEEVTAPLCLLSEKHFVTSRLMVRIGGLPKELPAALVSKELLDVYHTLAEKEEQLRKLGQALVEALHDAIGRLASGDPLRGPLLRLKRDIYNHRSLSREVLTVLDMLPIDCRTRVHDWGRLVVELNDFRSNADHLFSEQLAQKRSELRLVAALPHFRSALLLSSPAFEASLDDYIRANGGPFDRRLRRTERSLLLYLIRTCFKTSPFSTLTTVNMGVFRQNGTAMQDPHPKIFSCGRHTSVRPNLGILTRLTKLIESSAKIGSGVKISIPEDAVVIGKRVRYRRRTVSPSRRAGPLHTIVSEQFFYLPLSPSLDLILRLFPEKRECLTLGEVRAALEQQPNPLSNDAARLVALLIGVDFIRIIGLRQSILSPDFWGSYTVAARSEILDHDSPELQILSDLTTAAEGFGSGNPTEKRQLLSNLTERIATVLRVKSNDETIPRPLLYEDATLRTGIITVPRDPWDRHLHDLASLQDALPLFDGTAVQRAALSEFFLRKYGPTGICSSVLEFAEEFGDQYIRAFQTSIGTVVRRAEDKLAVETPNPLSSNAISSLDQLRSRFWTILDQMARRAPDVHTVVLPEESIQDIVRALPSRSLPLSHAFFCQPAYSDTEGALVLNRIGAGLGSMFSRFIHLFEGVPDHLASVRKSLRDWQPSNSVFAEIQGGHENNLNLHPRFTEMELLLPGEVASTGSAETILLRELSIIWDPPQKRLRLICDRLRKEVIPLYLGFLHPRALSTSRQVLLLFSPAAPFLGSFWAPFSSEQHPSEITLRPRLTYKSLVVERAEWTVPTSLIPRRGKGQSDFSYFCTIREWTRHHGLPLSFFARSRAQSGSGPIAGGFNLDKPLLLDLDQIFTIFLLEAFLSVSGPVIYFTEMLPGKSHAAIKIDGQRYVSEYVVEITRPGTES
jgi:hypothetical protein